MFDFCKNCPCSQNYAQNTLILLALLHVRSVRVELRQLFHIEKLHIIQNQFVPIEFFFSYALVNNIRKLL